MCVDGISQNLQSLNPYESDPPMVISFLRVMVIKSNNPVRRFQRVNRY